MIYIVEWLDVLGFNTTSFAAFVRDDGLTVGGWILIVSTLLRWYFVKRGDVARSDV